MEAQLINPFLVGALQVLEEFGISARRGELRLEESPLRADEVTVLIGIGGQVRGIVMLSMSSSLALWIAGRMMGEPVEELDELAKSAVAELGNIINGRAAMGLEKLGRQINISPPSVITGVGTEISTVNVQRLVVPLETERGALAMHVAIRSV